MQNIISYTHYADGKCDAVEHVPGYMGSQREFIYGETPEQGFHIYGVDMPEADLWIVGASLTIKYSGLSDSELKNCWAMSGIAGAGGDYLIPLFRGNGVMKIMFPAGYAMKLAFGDIASKHIDFHVWAPLNATAYWEGNLTIFTVPVD